jgi:glyoxylase-like metal-dependent hydrolase (beta-lactamase superfamily II)
MPQAKPMKFFPVKCKSTNCFVIEAAGGYLLFDTGWVNEYGDFRDNLKGANISPKDIKWFVVSHFHVDHAGLAGLLINNGKEFVVFENQREHIDEMEEFIAAKNYVYTKIDRGKILHKKLNASRDWLGAIGIGGEIIQVFGHGDQSVALLLDTGEAFTGDLPPIYEYDELVKRDWDTIVAKNAKYIYPAHWPGMEIEGIRR